MCAGEDQLLGRLVQRCAPHLAGQALTMETQQPATQREGSAVLWGLFSVAYEQAMFAGPVRATMVGDYRYNARVTDKSRKAFDANATVLRALLAEAEALSPSDLDEADEDNLNFFRDMCRAELLR